MQPISLTDLYCAISGRSNRPISPWVYANKITQVSNEVEPGSLFVALRGKRYDGHDFIGAAAEKGAAAVIVERFVDVNIPQILVPSTVYAMGDLARLCHARLNIPTVAVTGSVGKTSTKEMIAHVLSRFKKTHKSRENFNNELGVPIESFLIDVDHEISVLELAMRGRGQIEYLSRIVRPDIGVITNIGISHIELLGSMDNIAFAKSELALGMDAESMLVLNRDDKYYDAIRGVAPGKVSSFGVSPESEYRLSRLQLSNHGNPSFTVNGIPVQMRQCMGKQHAYNAAATFAVTSELGIAPEEVAESLVDYQTPHGRGKHSRAHSGAMILDNTYNAAPDSVQASFYTLKDLKDKGARVVAVIGDMLELGDHSIEAHKQIGDRAKDIGLDMLVTVGEYSRYVGEQAGVKAWTHFEDTPSAAQFLLGEVHKDDIVMLQGSRVMLLDTIVEVLEKGSMIFSPEEE